jgi:hypothetical protein
MFLSDCGVARQRLGRPWAGTTLQANCPHGSAASSSLTHGCSFRPRATPEQLPSPKRPPVGPTAAPSRRQTVSLCLSVWVALGVPGTVWDFHRSVWTAIVSRRDHQSPRRAAATNRTMCCGGSPPRFPRASAGLGAWHSAEAETWPLPNYPCLAPSSPLITGRCWLHTSP